jgi:Golgin subfamily A member 5
MTQIIDDLNVECTQHRVRCSAYSLQFTTAYLCISISQSLQVARAVDSVDSCLQKGLQVLRSAPVARLLLLVYLALLHVWVCIVLAFHSQSIEELHADTGGGAPSLPDFNKE